MLEGIDVVTLDLLKSNDRRLIFAGVATFIGGIAGGYLRRNKREAEDAEVAKLGINQPAVETTAQPSPSPAS